MSNSVVLLLRFVGQDSEEQPGSTAPAARRQPGLQCVSSRRLASAALSNETTMRLETHLQTLISNLGGAGRVHFEASLTHGRMLFRLQHGASPLQEPCLAHGPNSRTMHKTDNQLINVAADGWAYICCPHGGKCRGARFKLCRLQVSLSGLSLAMLFLTVWCNADWCRSRHDGAAVSSGIWYGTEPPHTDAPPPHRSWFPCAGVPLGVVLSARAAAHLGAKHAVPLDSLCDEDKDRLYAVRSFPCRCVWWGAHFRPLRQKRWSPTL